jgi:hypothetical protein
MRLVLVLILTLSVGLSSAALTGCGPRTPAPPAQPQTGGGHGHDHDHDHDHDHGPQGGEVSKVGNGEYLIEWIASDEDEAVRLFIYDREKQLVPIAASELVVATRQGDGSTQEHILTAVQPIDGRSAQFESRDKELLGTMDVLSDKVTAHVVEVEIDGERFTNIQLLPGHHH